MSGVTVSAYTQCWSVCEISVFNVYLDHTYVRTYAFVMHCSC